MSSDLLTAILLGLIEGVTEFIPVSSTGHLVLAAELFGYQEEATPAFKITIQLGAIAAILVLYRRRFWEAGLGTLRGDPAAIAFSRNILLGFLPAMAIGVAAYEGVRILLESPVPVAIALLLGGIVMLILDRRAYRATVPSVEALGWRRALAIGLVQCLAMFPGVSRSGATILGALAMGVERRAAAEYSFFLAVPTMLAATAYAIWKERDALGGADWTAIGLGFVAAFLSAMLVVRAFLAIVSRHGFAPFAWYRILAGAAALVWLLSR